MKLISTSTIATTALLLPASGLAALPPVPTPADNPLTEAKAVLGKLLFWDEQLSSDHTVACGTCHAPSRGGADDRIDVHPGADGLFGGPDDVLGSPGVRAADGLGPLIDPIFGTAPQVTPRATPTLFGSLWAPRLFWDGRGGPDFVDPLSGTTTIQNRGALETQAIGPILNDVEMSHAGQSWADVATRLAQAAPLELASAVPTDVAEALALDADYASLFTNAFGTPDITPQRIAYAIASYERTLVPDQAPFDAFDEGDLTALSPRAQRGFDAFRASQCDVCHTPPLFTNHTFRNIGLRPIAEDAGRQDVTGDPADAGRFKVPSLRNVALKDTFMHNGQLDTLEQVLAFYARAPGTQSFPQNRDPIIGALNVPPPAAADIAVFLREALTDPRVAAETHPFDRPQLHAAVDACRDGRDNDGDGFFDLTDPGCQDADDPAETEHADPCDDGLDRDRDGLSDLTDTDCDLDLTLAAPALTPGQAWSMSVTDARPGATVWFVGSMSGAGDGPCFPGLDVCAAIRDAFVLGTATVDAFGEATLTLTVPETLASGRTVWFQAAWADVGYDKGDTSNVLRRVTR